MNNQHLPVAFVGTDVPLTFEQVTELLPLVAQSPLSSAAVNVEPPRTIPVSVEEVLVPPFAIGSTPLTSVVRDA